MAPNTLKEDVMIVNEETSEKLVVGAAPRKYKVVWFIVAYATYVHIAAVYGLYLAVTSAMWPTIALTFINNILSILGLTAGVHRLWTHKSYKAKLPLQIFLMLCHTASNTFTSISWIRDHILHHKYTDTDADPHNSTRGFFFSHIGWAMVKKQPEARAKGKSIDLSELYANPVLRFQQKNAVWLTLLVAYIIPSLVPLIWNETFTVAYHMNLLRVTVVFNTFLLINSVAHMWGTRPYDETILPAQNKTVSFFTLGEGFHNYHHVFPHDYRTAELGDNFLNLTTKFIDFCAWMGQAYDRRYVPDDVIAARMKRTGETNEKNT
uniref:Fatty-acyl-CoA desaturase n=1 Tax=Operophtera brumata TaxID=104452 RepID=F8TIZ4_OPEBR|nr:fatty-acyl-CoA desaturase [Operophtera brumata]